MSRVQNRTAAARRVAERAMPSLPRRAPGVVLGVLADLCVVGLLGLSMWLIVRAGEQPPILHLTFAIVGVRAFAVGRAAFRYAERLFSHDAAFFQLSRLRSETFDALIPRIPGAIESHRRGEVLAAFVDDVDQLQDGPLRVRQPLVVSLVVVGLSVVAVGLISLTAALVLLILLFASGFIAATLARVMAGRYDRELGAARASLVDALLDRFSAAPVLVAFDAMPAQRERLAKAEQRLSEVQLRRARSAGLSGALLSLAAGLATLLTFSLLAPTLGTGSAGLSAPLFAAVVIVPAAVFEVFAQVPVALAARRAVAASAGRVAGLIEGELPREVAVDLPLTAASGSTSLEDLADPSAPLIEIHDLAVRHPGAAADAIRGVSFVLPAGDTLVVTGESGAGKSTLALALVRFLEYRGSYRLRGVEARDLPLTEVRAVVGLCEQHPHLFDADLRQNLKFARDSASDDHLMDVLDRVGLGEWARERGGLDAPIGERGALVSGGQAQRISLARAILADFPVIVLDEPTAGVDRELADRLLLDLVGAARGDRSVILITHTGIPAGLQAASLEIPVQSATDLDSQQPR